MKNVMLGAALACALTGTAAAATYDFRDFVESNWDYVTPQQNDALWTARYGDQNGSLLPPFGGATYGYACGTCTQVGALINTGDSAYNSSAGFASPGLPTFDGLFLHPGPTAESSVAIVFRAQDATWLDGVTVQAEMVVNGLYGNGVDIAVRHTRAGVSTSLGSYVVSGADYSEQSFSFGATPLKFEAGDRIEVDVGANGGYQYDHLSINVYTTAVAAVPEPGTYALMLAGLGLVLIRRRRAAS